MQQGGEARHVSKLASDSTKEAIALLIFYDDLVDLNKLHIMSSLTSSLSDTKLVVGCHT